MCAGEVPSEAPQLGEGGLAEQVGSRVGKGTYKTQTTGVLGGAAPLALFVGVRVAVMLAVCWVGVLFVRGKMFLYWSRGCEGVSEGVL